MQGFYFIDNSVIVLQYYYLERTMDSFATGYGFSFFASAFFAAKLATSAFAFFTSPIHFAHICRFFSSGKKVV